MATLTIFYYWIWNPLVTVKVSTPMEEKEGERKNLSKENLRQRQGGWVDFPYQRSIIYHSKIRLSTCRTEISKVSRYFSLTNQMVESSSNPTNQVHIISSCVHYIVLMIKEGHLRWMHLPQSDSLHYHHHLFEATLPSLPSWKARCPGSFEYCNGISL